jgi:signal transduction histidine kinase
MRTLSARILLGFAALAVAFVAITVNVLVNMSKVQDSIHNIREGHLPLAFSSKDLARCEEDLKSYLDDGFAQEPNAYTAAIALRTSRERRNAAFSILKTNVAKFSELGIPVDKSVAPSLDELTELLEHDKPSYDKLFAALRAGDALDSESVTGPAHQLRDAEHKVYSHTNDIATLLKRIVDLRTENLEENERKARLYAIVLGVIAIAIAIMMSIWVVVTLRPLRRLRAAAKRVGGGDYASRIDEKGPAEVAELAREFNSMARAVEERERELVRSERLAAVGKLSAMITHEIRNPLSAIGLNAELLDDELADNEEGRALCRAIHHEVDRLTAITEEYLAFGRLPKPKIASEHLNAMVEALASFVREDLTAKHVELALELADTDPIALVDASQLRQCLINLVRNAAEAVSSKGGGKVTIRTRKAGDRAVIEVEDTGVGIAPEVLPRLFDTFFSTKEGGSGLGLALTQQIVKDHGGDLAVESTVGRGTTFTVSIPRG